MAEQLPPDNDDETREIDEHLASRHSGPRLVRKNGKPAKNVANVLTILERDRAWQGVLAYDLLRETPILLKRPPMRTSDLYLSPYPREWTSQDSTRTAAWLLDTYGLDVSSGQVTEAMMAAAQQNEIHPIREYLDPLEWDRTERLELLFVDYFGCEDSPYVRGVARMFLISAIARVRRPGCKVDTMVILEGAQGTFKSSAVSVLAGAWFADTPLPIGDKDAYQGLRGKWIYEIGELASFRGRDAQRIKGFLSSPCDYYRPSFAATARDIARHCIFVGTTNDDQYLSDSTGARRFWPVKVGRIDLEALRRDRDQLWAEADYLFRSGSSWWPDPALAQLGAVQTEERYEDDPWDDTVLAWIARPEIVEVDREGHPHVTPVDLTCGVSIPEVLSFALKIPKERQGKREQMRVAHILKGAGWNRGTPELRNGIKERRWRRASTTSENGGVVAEVVAEVVAK